MGLEVTVYESSRRPARAELMAMHTERLGRRATPVIVVVLWGEGRAAICGPAGADVAVALDTDASQIERICDAALGIADRHSARRFLDQHLTQLDAPVPGLKNSGLFAMHELEVGVPQRADWPAAVRRAAPALRLRGHALLEGLGFGIRTLPDAQRASVLVAQDTKVAIALFLDRPDEIEPPSPRFDNNSPISFALAKADQENLDYVVVLAGSTLRVYPVKPQVGTARRGRTETFVEMNLDLMREEQSGYLWLLCSADALSGSATFLQVLARSADYAAGLGERLRDRVYEEVVPQLAAALVKARRLRSPSAEKLRETYEMALLVLFRLLFVAYAEDKELLPLHANKAYTSHSLKEIAKRLHAAMEKGEPFEGEDFYWTEVNQIWKAIDKGNRGWGVPRYNGGLFADDEDAPPANAALAAVTLKDADFGPPLAALLLERTNEGGLGPIDFRTLGVREFGTIYEGLLESELSVAETDLAVDPKSLAYVPVKGRAEVVVREGQVYLHNASGSRKASGAYYTKEFAVEHLLDHALEPALDDHFARLDACYEDRDAADRFFDFRVADIAMGSGHFLVAAVDHVERRFSNYLTRRRLPGVIDELARLRKTAQEELGEDWAGDPIEDTQLLRRQIARRCIFGVDLNPLAVELARLSVWIHTFVPGLPLSFLDQNFVQGNSLVGIATLDEATEVLVGGSGDLFAASAEELLGSARKPLERLARLAEATAAEVKEARRLYVQMREAIRGEEMLLTVLAASRVDAEVAGAVGSATVATNFRGSGDLFSQAIGRRAAKSLEGLDPLHFPIAFPQVFLGQRAGFDVIVGNPPWEKTQVEEHEFWSRHVPGYKGKSQAEREREIAGLRRNRADLVRILEAERARAERLREVLVRGPYPGMGSGHPDLYKAFCWRFWQLVAKDGGQIGVVLPRAVFSSTGSEEFRRALFAEEGQVDVTTLLNKKGWVFDNAEPRYTIALTAIRRGRGTRARQLGLRGPYASHAAYSGGIARDSAVFTYTDVRSWTSTLALPLLPSVESAEVFTKLRRSPRLEDAGGADWTVRPVQGDLNATVGKPFMDFSASPSKMRWPVFAGESFDLWTPETGKIYAVAEAKPVLKHLQERRLSSARQARSAFAGFPPAVIAQATTLPCRSPRIAFRDVTNRTNRRTVIVCLVPPELFLIHNAPYLLWPRGEQPDEAFLLGVLCSICFDWYARRFVETHVTFDILNELPVPSVRRTAPLRRRIVDLAGRLAAQDPAYHEWAAAVGLEPRRLAEDEQDDHIAELDAAVARLYGLDEPDLVHIFATFHEGWDYQDRMAATLKHFRALKRLV